jgi:TfoX/Sxy family transcriptional regulator of competence genes
VPIDEKLAEAVRAALAGTQNVREQKMFGGIGFMVNGNMVAGASSRGLLLRVGKDQAPGALGKSGTRPMIMRGRRMDDYVYVDSPIDPRSVKSWVQMALAFVLTLPPKKKKK